MAKTITIAIGTVFQDAGDATRALEIAQAISEHAPQGVHAKIVFLSRGSRFEKRAEEMGFEVFKADPPMSGVGLHQDLKMKPGELVGEPQIAYELLKGEIAAYNAIKPDVILHGFWPFGSIARRMMAGKPVPGICFIPLPIHENLLSVLPDAPEDVKAIAWLPRGARKFLINHVPGFVRRRLPLLRHRNISLAAQKLGWKGRPLSNIFDMLEADLTLVNDLPDFYVGTAFPETFRFTGPIFSLPTSRDVVDERIQEVFAPELAAPKVFCTLGSSGTQDQLLEVVKVFTAGAGLKWNAVILSPSSVCPLDEARRALGGREGVHLTDRFVPARLVNAMADVVICHGGQGTLQTAICSGTPLVGLATQSEQQINLDHIAMYGGGIRVPRRHWRCETIRESVDGILMDRRYKENSMKLKGLMERNNGKEKSALAVWEFLRNRGTI